MELRRCVRARSPPSPDMPDREVFESSPLRHALARRLDEAGHLLGAVTVDDVVDRMLAVAVTGARRHSTRAATRRGSDAS